MDHSIVFSRRPVLFLGTVVAITMGLAVGAAPASSMAGDAEDPTLRRERERAVLLAREGEVDEAILLLRQLRGDHPEDRPLAEDLLVVLQWAGEDSRVLELATELTGAEDGAPPEQPLPPPRGRGSRPGGAQSGPLRGGGPALREGGGG